MDRGDRCRPPNDAAAVAEIVNRIGITNRRAIV
jgi:hypothetical protein